MSVASMPQALLKPLYQGSGISRHGVLCNLSPILLTFKALFRVMGKSAKFRANQPGILSVLRFSSGGACSCGQPVQNASHHGFVRQAPEELKR